MLFKKSVPESYELIDQSAPLDLESGLQPQSRTSRDGQNETANNNSHNNDSNGDDDERNSDDGERNSERNSSDNTSEIFDDIDAYAYKNHTGDPDDDFNNNPRFQNVFLRYAGSKPVSRKTCGIISGISIFFWFVALLVYSSTTPHKIIQDLNWQTNVPQLNGVNVTLNHYEHSRENVTMKSYRQQKYLPFQEDIHWLRKEQFPKEHEPSAGGYYLTRNNKGGFVIKQAGTAYAETIIESVQFAYQNNFFYIDDFVANPARSFDSLSDNYHIVVTDRVTQWRHSSFAIYWLYNPMTAEYIPIQPPAKEVLSDEHDLGGDAKILEKLHFAEFSPNGNYVVFGFDNNLYLMSLLGTEKDKVTKITHTGSHNVYNGKPDWVYEEEVIPDYKLIWWSPDSENLVYATLNDTNVKEYNIDYYVKDAQEVTESYSEILQDKVEDVNQYPIKSAIKYPKPGTPNPTLTLHNFQLSAKKVTDINIQDEKLGQEVILYDAKWVDSKNLLLKLSDRTSSILAKKVYQPSVSSTDLINVSTIDSFAEYQGWVEKIPPIGLIPSETEGQNSYIDKVVVNKHVHLALFDSAVSPNYSKLLTSSDSWDVLYNSPIVYNHLEEVVYCLTTVRSTMDAHVVAVKVKEPKISEPQMITGADKDGLYSMDFSDDGQFLNLKYDGPLQPWQKVINMGDMHDFILSKDSKIGISGVDEFISSIKPINHFEITKQNLDRTNLPTRVYRKVQVGKYPNGKPIELNMIEILPPNFDPKSGRKHPLLVHAYGGPGSTTVTKGFSVDFQDIVSATLDAVVLIIDPRGTGDQDWNLRSFATNNIGYWEPRDITSVASEYIAANKDYIDKYRTAIWGWSYGGFTTLKTLEYDAGKTFNYGMAVAPVTNWLFYDSIYTERYMGMPDQNEKYQTQSQLRDFANFQQLKRFLVMHGTGDDNVHLQNSLWLLDKFDLNGVENYDVHFFPDSDHSIYYHNANTIIFDKLLRWLTDAFAGRLDEL